MFNSARINLTVWYLIIITAITVMFSFAVYKGFTLEFDRIARIQRVRMEDPNVLPPQREFSRIDAQLIEEAKDRIAFAIFLVDLGVIAGSSIAAYFLAGRTLKPIEEMVEEQKRFTADASHELRTPLAALKSEIEVALRDKKLSLLEAKELLNSNLEEVDKLKSLSDYLLTLNKYQGSDILLDFEKIKLSNILREAQERLVPLAEKKNIKIKANLSGSIKGNSKSLVQLLIILLDNAIKFSPKGARVEISSKKVGNHLIIKVEDHGVGIKEKDLPYIFDRFYQADTSRAKTQEGFGLGLAIAKRIVELHKGSITVVSKEGKGAIFTVKLPLK